jgi:hypothetical protein
LKDVLQRILVLLWETGALRKFREKPNHIQGVRKKKPTNHVLLRSVEFRKKRKLKLVRLISIPLNDSFNADFSRLWERLKL